MAELFRFAAFISYSSKDAAFAKRLHHALENYHIPKQLGSFDLVGGGKKNRIYPVCKDREEFPSGELGEKIEAALKASAALVVVCSPNAAASPWVNKEIETFLSFGRRDRIFPIIADDAPLADPDSADSTALSFPPAFRGKGLGEGAARFEPLAADARKGKDGFRAAWLKVVAGLIGVNAGALADRDKRRRQGRQIQISAVVSVSILLAAIATASSDSINKRTASSAKFAVLLEQGHGARSAPYGIAALPELGAFFLQSGLTKSNPLLTALSAARFLSLGELKSFDYSLSWGAIGNAHSTNVLLFLPKPNPRVILFGLEHGQAVDLGNSELKGISKTKPFALFQKAEGGEQFLLNLNTAERNILENCSHRFTEDGARLEPQSTSNPEQCPYNYVLGPTGTLEIEPSKKAAILEPFNAPPDLCKESIRFGPIRSSNESVYATHCVNQEAEKATLILFASDKKLTFEIMSMNPSEAEGRMIESLMQLSNGHIIFTLEAGDYLELFLFNPENKHLQTLGVIDGVEVSKNRDYFVYYLSDDSNFQGSTYVRMASGGSSWSLGKTEAMLLDSSGDWLLYQKKDDASLVAFHLASRRTVSLGTWAAGVDLPFISANGFIVFRQMRHREETEDWYAWNIEQMLDEPNLLDPPKLRDRICVNNGGQIAPLDEEIRIGDGDLVNALRGRPWNPCDWRGLLAIFPDPERGDGWFEGLNQWLRLMHVRYFGGKDWSCEETLPNASEKQKADRARMCQLYGPQEASAQSSGAAQ
jgi:hypothetical protein